MSYRLTYDVTPHPEGVDKPPKGHGACDALLLASLIFPEDGSLSTAFVSYDGRTGKDLDPKEWFKVWTLLAYQLAETPDLDPAKVQLCKFVFETIRDGILQARGIR